MAENKRYDPSALPGALALGGIGATALYLGRRKIPFLNQLIKMNKLKAPSTPARPVTMDKVTETLATAQTPTVQSMELVAQTPKAVQHAKDYRATMDLIQAKSIKLPLSQGSGKGRFGSSLYDWVAQHPSLKPLPAKIWADQLKKSQKLSEFKSGNPGYQGIRMNVSRKEIEDANIAYFNKENELVGGFLNTAAKANMEVHKTDLLKMIINSPAVNLKVKRFEYITNPAAEISPIMKDSQTLLKKMYDKINIQQPSAGGTVGEGNLFFTNKNKVLDKIAELQKDLGVIEQRVQKDFQHAENITNHVENVKSAGTQIKSIEKLVTDINKQFAKINMQPIANQAEIKALQTRNLSLMRKLGREKTQNQSPRYGVGDHQTYTMHGDERYIEDVIYYPKKIPYNRNVSPSHYETVKDTDFMNQIYHTRYGMRTVGGPERNKAFVLHEAQSDVHQKAYEAMMNYPDKLRVNPFNTEAEFAQATRALQNIWDKIKVIHTKQWPTYADRKALRSLREQGEELRKNTINASNISQAVARRSDNTIPFLPMLERDVWGDHLVKHMAKTAAANDVKWFAIHPVERLHVLKRSGDRSDAIGKMGDWEFYGTATGKGGMPGVKGYSDVKRGNVRVTPTNPKLTAVLPERMIKLAKQYNSEARTIMISKSDPTKPWKVVQSTSAGPESNARKLGFRKPVDEHVMAFETEAEAKAFIKEAERINTRAFKILKLEANDPRLYSEAFGLKITPDMLEKPFKLYKKTGGLVVDIFKW